MCASLTFPKGSRCNLIFGASVSQKYSYFEQFHSKLHIEKYLRLKTGGDGNINIIL